MNTDVIDQYAAAFDEDGKLLVRFKRTDEARYDEMLGIMPPVLHLERGFLVGEPWSHRLCAVTGHPDAPTFQAHLRFGDGFYEADRGLTVREFNSITRDQVLDSIDD